MAKVFTTLRWLRPYASKSGHQVFIRVRIRKGSDFNIPVYDYINHEKLPISVKKEHWNKGYIIGGTYHKSIREINSLLSKVENDVKFAVKELLDKNVQINQENIINLTYINEINALENERRIASGELIVDEQDGAFASQTEFIDFISESEDPRYDKLKKSMGLYEKKYILDYWDNFITEYAPDSYNSPRYAIKEYIDKTDDNCKVVDFSSPWLYRFFEHLIKEGYSFKKDGTDRQPYSIPTIAKYAKHLKTFGDYLFYELKLIDNQDYKRFTLYKKKSKQSLIKYRPKSFINTHALYKREFDYFYGFKFEDKKLGLVRDMFVLQVWLGGLREKDFYRLSEQNFHKDSQGIKVWFNQHKTDDEVLNTINQNYLKPILNKYPNIFKEFIKVHQYNILLKKAAFVAGLNRTLMFKGEQVDLKEAKIEWIEIFKRISNNWARNCAVSILAELGYPDDRIAKFTGHKDLDMINHYKSVHKKDVKSMLEEVKPERVRKL
ncbi:MAG: tyrosine-type recombinase/integrase [Bacteroidales bacterium]|nr:tyrosine-type recombinase/integrase [Bacteroidales bacterium]